MSQFLEQKALFDGILLLREEEVRAPMEVLERFFSDYHLHECRYILSTMLETCLTTDNPGFSEPGERASLIMNCKNLERLIEAGALLLKRHRLDLQKQLGKDLEKAAGQEEDGPGKDEKN